MTDDSMGQQLTDEQYWDLLAGMLDREPIETLAPKVAAWRLEPTTNRLKRFRDQAIRLGRRLNKGNIRVETRSHNLRTEPAMWARFWSSLVHAIRNAVDHGLETPEERRAAGKPEFGKIFLATECRRDRFVVSIGDDGRGIDWQRIAELANEKGLPSDSREDLIAAMFFDGLSTNDEITETSGRGVGMAALHEACMDLGGNIEVKSEPGVGTTFEFVFPLLATAPQTNELLVDHGIEVDMRSLIAAH